MESDLIISVWYELKENFKTFGKIADSSLMKHLEKSDMIIHCGHFQWLFSCNLK